MPVSGKIVEFNPDLNEDEGDNPTLVNDDPYGKGWIVKIEINNLSDLDGLLDSETYTAEVKS